MCSRFSRIRPVASSTRTSNYPNVRPFVISVNWTGLVTLEEASGSGEVESGRVPCLDAAVEHPVVLVCQSGGRASQAHNKLTNAGKHTLHVLEGGMTSWQAAGGDVVYRTTERWAMDRQVRGVAGTIVLIAMALSTRIPGAKWIAGGVGAGLTFSAASNTCAMGTVLSKLPYNQTDSCDIEGVLAKINRPNT